MKLPLVSLSLLLLVLGAGARAQEADPIADIRAQLKNPDAMFTLLVEMHIKPGSEKQFRKLAQEAVRNTRQEPGNAAYEVHQDAKNPGKFVFFEKWRGISALTDHVAKDYTKALLSGVSELAESPMTIRLLTPFVPQGNSPRNPALKGGGAAKPADSKPKTDPAAPQPN
jgi:quinol monooxygenase YgiN